MVPGRTNEFSLWALLVGSGCALLFPDVVLTQGMFVDSFLDRNDVRLIAAPLFIAAIVLLTDLHRHWSAGMFR